MPVEDWERQRACLSGKPGLWDADAGLAAHLEAARICRSCPVTEQCADDVQGQIERGLPVEGLFAGSMWGRIRNRNVRQTVEEWHETHSIAGAPESNIAKAEVEERRCIGPGCEAIFEVTWKNKLKTVCSNRCSHRVRDLAAKAKRKSDALARMAERTAV
jgi:hypothetical protein